MVWCGAASEPTNLCVACRHPCAFAVRVQQVHLRFHIPQLCTFFLYGGLENTSVPLQQWLLAKCSQSPEGAHFAHTLHWFLKAHAELPDHATAAAATNTLSGVQSVCAV